MNELKRDEESPSSEILFEPIKKEQSADTDNSNGVSKNDDDEDTNMGEDENNDYDDLEGTGGKNTGF